MLKTTILICAAGLLSLPTFAETGWAAGLGQRDVNDAPPLTAYGFDESLTNFEGMGAKLLPMTETPTKNGGAKRGRLWKTAVNLGEPVEWKLLCDYDGGRPMLYDLDTDPSGVPVMD